MYYVYLLYSEKLGGYYIGYSENPEKRLEERHNKGAVKATKNGMPYILRAKKLFLTEAEAMAEERRIKKMKSSKYIGFLIQ